VPRAVRSPFEEMCGAESPGWGIDGCSAPNFATTVTGLARAMARMADPRGLGPAREEAARRLVAAMVAHPLLVAGEGRACSELMSAMDGAVAVKTGAEAVYVAILPARGLGVALKVEDGATRASESAIVALLVRLGAIAADHPAAARRLNPPIVSRRGFPAGTIRPAPEFFAGGAPI
jgi:L-asparaginase II